MKILVVSDSHGKTNLLTSLSLKEKCDYYFHCGDSCDDKDSIYPFISVKGNCDAYPFEKELILKIGNFRFLITHGHLIGLMGLKYKAIDKSVNVVLTGHTHIPHEEIVDDILFLNPGSVSKPRNNNGASYLVLEYDDNESDINNIKVTFKTVL